MNTVKSEILPKLRWLKLSGVTRSSNHKTILELYQVLEGQMEQILNLHNLDQLNYLIFP